MAMNEWLVNFNKSTILMEDVNKKDKEIVIWKLFSTQFFCKPKTTEKISLYFLNV
jgi:hypothetical protein